MEQLNRIIRERSLDQTPVSMVLQVYEEFVGAKEFVDKLDGSNVVLVNGYRVTPVFHRVGKSAFFYSLDKYVPSVMHFALTKLANGTPFFLSQPLIHVNI